MFCKYLFLPVISNKKSVLIQKKPLVKKRQFLNSFTTFQRLKQMNRLSMTGY